MIPCLATAWVNRFDLVNRLLWSIDFPVNDLLLINNSGKDETVGLPPWVMSYHGIDNKGNMGCGPSWNQAFHHAFIRNDYPYVVLLGNDIQLTKGDLKKIEDAYDEGVDFISANQAFGSWALTKKGFRKFGWMDENIYPAYGEDVDYWHRMHLTGATVVSVDTHMIHGEAPHWGSSSIYSDPELKRKNDITHDRNLSYLERKWNWDRRKPISTSTFTTPFNDPHSSVNDWQLSLERLKQPHFRTHG